MVCRSCGPTSASVSFSQLYICSGSTQRAGRQGLVWCSLPVPEVQARGTVRCCHTDALQQHQSASEVPEPLMTHALLVGECFARHA